jgi:cell division septal protein FtsQ
MKRYRARSPVFDRFALASGLVLPGLTRGAPARGGAARRGRPPGRPARAWSTLAPLAGVAAAALGRHRRLRLALLALLALAPLGYGGWRWLRSSSLVAVEHVAVSGVRGPDASEVEHALTAAAQRMTTLDLNERTLLAAVAPFRLVRALTVSASFPHGLHIRVIEQLPVATLNVGGVQTALAADGAVLGSAFVSSRLPAVSGAYVPPSGAQVHDASLRGTLEVLGAAPAPLVPYIARAFEGPRGLEVAMRDGVEAYFGDASRPHAKWLALALVLADPSAAHASAVDVRTPERPAAQFPAGYAPTTAAAAEGSSSAGGSSSESIATQLAAGLAASAGYGSSAEAQGANAAKAAEALSPSHSTTTSETTTTPGSESGSRAGAESSTSAPGESAGGAPSQATSTTPAAGG